MNTNERRALLDKLKIVKEISDEPLKAEADRTDEINFQQEMKRLGIFQKLLLLIQQIFTGKEPAKLLEESMLKRVVEKTQHQAPTIVNFTSKKLLDGFCKELISINNHLSKIKEPFQNALETNRKDFFAFFVSIELETIHEKLIEELDPKKIQTSQKLDDQGGIKDIMQKTLSSIISGITETDRSKLNHHAFALHHLYKLCCFPFDTLISQFNAGNVSINSVIKDLARLLDLLQSASYPPPAEAIEAVIMFFHQDTLNNPEIEIDEAIKTTISRVEAAFSAIRKFNKTVPLLNIIKCSTRNLNFKPKILKGGDDWFVLFKNYWETKINETYKAYCGNTKKISFVANAKDFLKADKIPSLTNYNTEKTDKKYSFQYTSSTGFILAFCERIYAKILNKSLNALLLQGSFYKQENRAEFTDTYNYLNTLHKKLLETDLLLSASSEWGIKLERIHMEIIRGNMNLSHMDVVIKDIDKKFKGLIDDTIKHLTTAELVLNGVLFSQVGSKFDSISNLKTIGGKANTDYINSWKVSLSLLHRANELLREAVAMECKNQS